MGWLLVVAQLLPTIVALIKQIQEILDDGPQKKAMVAGMITQLVAETDLPEAEKVKATLAATGMIDPLVSTLKATEWQAGAPEEQ
jgi:hypothetical protein